MVYTGIIDDIYPDDNVVKFKFEDNVDLDYIKLPEILFKKNIKVDSRYKIIITEIPIVDRSREIDE